MKKRYLGILNFTSLKNYRFILLLFIACFQLANAQPVKIMSFNIRYDSPNDGDNKWQYRREALVKLIDYYQPDFLGTQEGMPNQLNYMDTILENYAMIGLSREGTQNSGEFCKLFYDSLKYELLTKQTFWLSETPDKISMGWDAAFKRICTFGHFKEKLTGKTLYVLNTHFDHVGVTARQMSAKILVKKIEKLVPEGACIVLLGDFNCTPESEPIRYIKTNLDDGAAISRKSIYGPVGTFNGFNPVKPLSNRIDYIFTRNLFVRKYRHIDDSRIDGGFISDHLPVYLEAAYSD